MVVALDVVEARSRVLDREHGAERAQDLGANRDLPRVAEPFNELGPRWFIREGRKGVDRSVWAENRG